MLKLVSRAIFPLLSGTIYKLVYCYYMLPGTCDAALELWWAFPGAQKKTGGKHCGWGQGSHLRSWGRYEIKPFVHLVPVDLKTHSHGAKHSISTMLQAQVQLSYIVYH